MASYEHPFNWQNFPEGRARFSGGVRGADEQGHETFAIEVEGEECFGEIERAFLANDNDFNIEVVSFGYGSENDVGLPVLGACRTFSLAQIDHIQTLAIRLINAGARFEERPHFLKEYPSARFMGEVLFREGWAVVEIDEVMP